MILSVDDIRYSVTVHRDQPDLPHLLMLHGFMGSSRVFEHLLPRLDSFCNPVTVDLLGHGMSDTPDNAMRFSARYQVRDLDTLIRKLDKLPLFLYGYSMGGRLALQYVVRHSERLAGLILESATAGLEDPGERAERRQADEQRALEIENDFAAFRKEWAKLPLFDNGIAVPEELSNIYRTVREGQEPRAMAASLRTFGTGTMPQMWDRLKELDLPVLLLAGAADSKYCSICSDMNKLIPGSRFESVENAGHRVHLENPEKLVERVKIFIDSVL